MDHLDDREARECGLSQMSQATVERTCQVSVERLKKDVRLELSCTAMFDGRFG